MRVRDADHGSISTQHGGSSSPIITQSRQLIIRWQRATARSIWQPTEPKSLNWEWDRKWKTAYPEYEPIFTGNAFDRVDTSSWMPGLEEAVQQAAYTGDLPDGARAALMNQWVLAGKPMDDFDTWVKSVVMPAMLYDGR